MTDMWTCPECGKEYDRDEQLSAMQQHKYQRHALDDGEVYIQRYKRIKSELPEKYRDAYHDITGSGKGPLTVQAAVCYIESSATIYEAAEIFDINRNSISQMVHELIDRGVVTLSEVRENCVDNGLQMFGEKRYEGEQSPNLQES